MIIGIVGTNGSGKGSVVDYLKEIGFIHYSVRAFIENLLEKEGIFPSRRNLIMKGNELRKQKGADYIIKEIYNKSASETSDIVIESIRCLAEITFLKKKKDVLIFGVDANTKLRFSRIKKRNSNTDHISYDSFIKEEMLELSNVSEFKQNILGCISKADYVFYNNGTKEELNYQLDKVIKNKLVKL